MTEKITIGEGKSGIVRIDLPVLIDTRLLIQANSGGGKSYLIRKILEESHGKVQQIVLDLEGEFASLREKYDYILVGKDGDIDVNIRSAELLARKLLELNVSVIIDLYELKHHERILFVKRFLDSLINAPKSLWHPCMVVVDEAHIFAPEKGSAESLPSVIDLATRGRKRGFCAIIATQRLSKLHKDIAAECINKLIGRTGLDIDMKRASDELGFISKHQMLSLRDLEPGEFFAFGSAISKSIVEVKIGRVNTTHPKAGSRRLDVATPPAPERVKRILSKLGDLPRQAEDELRTIEDFKRKIRELKHQLRSRPRPEMDEDLLERKKQDAYNSGLRDGGKRADSIERELSKRSNEHSHKIKKINAELEKIIGISTRLGDQLKNSPPVSLPEAKPLAGFHPKPEPKPASFLHPPPPPEPPQYQEDEYPKQLRAGAMKMLKAIVMLHPRMITRNQVAVLSAFSARGGTFNTYLQELKRNEWIYEENGLIGVTDEGMKNVGDVPELPTDSHSIVEMWVSKFRRGAGMLLKKIAEEYPNPISKDELGDRTDYVITGGTFNTYLQELRRSGLITINGSEIKATKELFLED